MVNQQLALIPNMHKVASFRATSGHIAHGRKPGHSVYSHKPCPIRQKLSAVGATITLAGMIVRPVGDADTVLIRRNGFSP